MSEQQSDRIVTHGTDVTDHIKDAILDEAIKGATWVPHARAHIRRGQICKLKLEGKTYQEIADIMGMSIGGVFEAVRRMINTSVDSGDLKMLLSKQVESINLRRELAIKIAMGDPARKEASNFEILNALDRWNSADESERALLGLNAPKSIHLSGNIGGMSATGLPPAGGVIDIEMIKQVQELDPVLRPEDLVDEELCKPVDGVDPDEEQRQAQEAIKLVDQAQDLLANDIASRKHEFNENPGPKILDFKIL